MTSLFLDRSKAAALLGISIRTLDRTYVATGQLSPIRFPTEGNIGKRPRSRKTVFLAREVEALKK